MEKEEMSKKKCSYLKERGRWKKWSGLLEKITRRRHKKISHKSKL